MSQQYQDLCNAKLAHYNNWLKDHKQGTNYPGFPRQGEIDVLTGRNSQVIAAISNTKPIKAGTKQEQAISLYAANKSKTKSEMIELFVSTLNMTKAGATTYYYVAKKVVA